MHVQVERWRANAAESATDDLLDRVTVLRPGMELMALEIIEKELRSRGVTDEQVEEYRFKRENEVIWREPGLAWLCSYCARPAVAWEQEWIRLLWIFPIYPRPVRCCKVHQEALGHGPQ